MSNFVAVTRFSLLHPGSAEWHLSTTYDRIHDINDYKSTLFDPSRLAVKFKIFSEITVPNLAAGVGSNSFLHLVQFSDTLPDYYQLKLQELATKFNFILLDKINFETNRYDSQQNHVCAFMKDKADPVFSIFNIDDDDVLSPDYFTETRKYLISDLVGCYLSFPTGISGLYSYENDAFLNCRKSYSPNINIGLTKICKFDKQNNSIISPESASHTDVDKYAPTIHDSRKIMYMWTKTPTQDTNFVRKGSEIEFINQSLDAMPPLESNVISALNFINLNIKSYDQLFENSFNGNVDLDLNSPYVFVNEKRYSSFVLRYQINCFDLTEPNKAFAAIVFEGPSPDRFEFFTLSSIDNVGYYRYLNTTGGVVDSTITISPPSGFLVKEIRFYKYATTKRITLERISIMKSAGRLL